LRDDRDSEVGPLQAFWHLLARVDGGFTGQRLGGPVSQTHVPAGAQAAQGGCGATDHSMLTLEAAVPDIPPEDMSVAIPAPEKREQYFGGRLLAEITDRLVLLIREHYGRGPINAKTYLLDDLIVCVLSDGFIAIERTMMEGGSPERVLELRREFQRLMETRYTEMVEELTGRKVLAFLSQTHVEPDRTVEMFLMDGRLPGFGALELVDPGDS
ncbi:MAG: Na-translocating system protein MpsC family protein, partial [Solirubrobacteraceae bacterium]